MNSLRKHLSYANVVATHALVFAMSGGALAAKHYLINSTSQINPKVLQKLKGNAGKAGTIGPVGPAGSRGPGGAAGVTGGQGSQGPGGTLATGRFNVLKSTFSDVINFSTEYTHPKTGIYCFEPTGGLSSVTSPIAMVTVDCIESSGSELSAYADSRNEDCAAGAYEVRTFEPAGKPADLVSFYIAVPSQ
jgi:hypothetical protein